MSKVEVFRIVHLVTLIAFAVGPLIAWKFWNRVGLKFGISYYVVRYGLIATLISFSGQWSPWGDIVGWYQHACWMVDDGLCPGHGFCSPYHLGFNGLLALSVWMWHSPCAIVLTYTLIEAVGILLIFDSIRSLYTVCLARRVVILTLSSPVVMGCAFATQDEPIILCGIAAILWASVRSRRFVMYLAAFLTFAFTKVLAPLYFVAFFVRMKWKGIALLVACLLAYWGIAYALNVNPFDFRFGRSLGMNPERLDVTIDHIKIGTIWTFAPHTSPLWQCFVLFAVLAAVGLCFVKKMFGTNKENEVGLKLSVTLATVIYLVFNVAYSMSYVGYMIPALPFVILLVLNYEGRWRGVLVGGLWFYLFLYASKDGASGLLDLIDKRRVLLTCGLVVADLAMLIIALKSVREYLTNPLIGMTYLFRKDTDEHV